MVETPVKGQDNLTVANLSNEEVDTGRNALTATCFYNQNELQVANSTKSNITLCKLFTDQTPSTSQKASVTDKMDEGILDISMKDKTKDSRMLHIQQDLKMLPGYNTDKETSKFSFECKECGGVFEMNKGLRNHMARIHNIRKYKCKNCRICFAYPGKLKDHYMTVHTSAYFHCCFCSYKFKKMKDFNSHKRVHHGKSQCSKRCKICKENTLLKKKLNEICLKH